MWWQWLLSIPAATNPNLDETGENCAVGQSGRVWFLAGSFGGTFERICTVPLGTALLFPILNAVFGSAVGDCEPSVPGVQCNVNVLRAGAAAIVDNPKTLVVSVDNAMLQALETYRVRSPIFSLTLPEGAVFGLPSGMSMPNVSDGYWLMLTPLSPGEHTIYIKGVTNSDFVNEVTYHLTVGQ
jgi:hypothetical protein